MSQGGCGGRGSAGVDCPDCRGRNWEIALRKPSKRERHPQDRPSLMGRILACLALMFVGLPLIAAAGFAALQALGGLGAGLMVSGATAALVMIILVIEGFGSSGKIGALRCKDCGFEQRAEVGPG